jgi:hypothetical protein
MAQEFLRERPAEQIVSLQRCNPGCKREIEYRARIKIK